MDIVFEHIPADRGFLMLEDEDGADKLVPDGDQAPQPELGADRARSRSPRRSPTACIKDRVSILTSDAMVDPRFGAGDSIRFHGIRSAMCAPLWNKDQVIGIIHVDSPMLTNCFTLNDLDLLTALANYAAVAVERARLNQKIVAEEKKRERLGRFLSPQVTSRILATSESQGAALGVPEVKDVSVLFADIVGFTTHVREDEPGRGGAAPERLPLAHDRRHLQVRGHPRQVHRRRHHGGLRRAPRHARPRRPRDQGRPRDAGAARPSSTPSARKGPHLRIRIGINSGKAVAGEIGSINKKEYTVLGDTVNTASRLESSVAKPGHGRDRREHLQRGQGPVRVQEPRAPSTLKGKENEVAVYEVLGAWPRARRRRAASPGVAWREEASTAR